MISNNDFPKESVILSGLLRLLQNHSKSPEKKTHLMEKSLVSTRICEKFLQKFTPKLPPKRRKAKSAYENSPILSKKIHHFCPLKFFPQANTAGRCRKIFHFLEDSLKGHAWIIFHSAREVDGTLHCYPPTPPTIHNAQGILPF